MYNSEPLREWRKLAESAARQLISVNQRTALRDRLLLRAVATSLLASLGARSAAALGGFRR